MTLPQAVLVTGVGGPSGSAATAALRMRGYTVLTTDIRPVAHQSDGFFEVAPASAPRFLDDLWRIVCEQDVRWLFPTVSDELVPVADSARKLRSAGVAVSIASPEAVRICNDKWLTAQCLRAHGVPVPAAAIGDAGDPAVRALGFPVLSKPRVGRGGRGVVVHDAPGIAPAGDNVVWQEFLSGRDYDVLIVLDPRPPHACLAHQVFEKTKLKEGRVGNALTVMEVEAPDVLVVAEAAARAAGVWGPSDIDVRRDAQGPPRVLEINARIGAHTLKAPQVFDALCALREAGGFDR